jgi:1-acyl-sn-glycerol-3-phosphate acyltransferase
MGLGLSLSTLYELALVSVPTYFQGLFRPVPRATIDARARQVARRIVARARIQVTVTGAEQIPLDRAYVYMSNHQSHLDIPVLYYAVPSPTLRMVAKTELFRIPIWGRAIRHAGMIEIDRSSRSQAIDSLEAAGRQIQDGVSVWLAPEGTRSRTGEIGPLKKGGFHLAVATQTPIVPVAIDGTRRILPAAAIRMAHDGEVRVTLGPPISVHNRTISSLMAEVEAFLRQHVESSPVQSAVTNDTN